MDRGESPSARDPHARRVFVLNVHASYRCQHSGACCTAGWSIPVEPRTQPLTGSEWLVPESDGACPQFDRRSGLCRIHRDHGEAMLPESCDHFPRRALIDGRGTFVTLSHFCPTAAALLLDTDEPLTVVQDPPAFPPQRGYEGLTVMDEWPPLLRPDALFDNESFAEWEGFLVRTLGSSAGSVTDTLASIAGAGERLRGWTSDQGSLIDWTRHALHGAFVADDEVVTRYAGLCGSHAYRGALATVPAGLSLPAIPEMLSEWDAAFLAPAWERHAPAILRYLGARAFASWTAYQSHGLRTQIAELFLTASVLRVECAKACAASGTVLERRSLLEGIRASDWLLVHLSDRRALMTWLGVVEAPSSQYARR